MGNQDQKRQKDTPQDKSENKGFVPPGGYKPKPFEQFSNPNKFKGGSQGNFGAFHRRLNTRRSSGGK